MKIYTIVDGVNGVGKSSFTRILKEQRSDLGILIDVNKITAELGGNALTGGKAALKKINECIEKGVSFTQETTLSGRRTAATAREVIEKGVPCTAVLYRPGQRRGKPPANCQPGAPWRA